MAVYPPWTREVAGSNPASQTKESYQVYLNLISENCSISIVVSAFDFLSRDKGSIPLWSTILRYDARLACRADAVEVFEPVLSLSKYSSPNTSTNVLLQKHAYV